MDPGSSHTFVSQTLADQLMGSTLVAKPFIVQVADGGQLLCALEFQACAGNIHSYEFQSNIKIIPLQFYDMIVGMDWLEQHSPMQIHWLHKWMILPYKGHLIQLQGEPPSECSNLMVGIAKLQEDAPP